MGEGGGNNAEPDGIFEASRRKVFQAKAGADGRLTLPPEASQALGLGPGAEVEVAVEGGRIEVGANIHSLARVYIEPTSRCNLSCRVCIRNTWKEPLGEMSPPVFDRLLEQLRAFPHLGSVMFGGFGEPTLHPDILRMLGAAKTLGVRTEMVTNGTRLDDAMLEGLLESRLDTLWVSCDGVSQEGFAAMRGGAGLRAVVESLRRLQGLNRRGPHRVEVGISFVVAKRNIGELYRIDRLIDETGARRIMLTNVLPYSEETAKEMVCSLALAMETFSSSAGKAVISLPRLDVTELTKGAIFALLRGRAALSLMGNPVSTAIKSCRFIKDRCAFVRWDGRVAPCMGLLHSHTSYLYGQERSMEAYLLGSVADGNLSAVWDAPEYRGFREKVAAFDFSPCHICGGCGHIDANKDDCSGSAFPACGGCLWAQGLIQCP